MLRLIYSRSLKKMSFFFNIKIFLMLMTDGVVNNCKSIKKYKTSKPYLKGPKPKHR